MIIFCALVITPVIFFACYVNIPWMQSDAFKEMIKDDVNWEDREPHDW